jgi:hypothetical protein
MVQNSDQKWSVAGVPWGLNPAGSFWPLPSSTTTL